jgi:imidazole glycerol-phosphate synthase subunit HisF
MLQTRAIPCLLLLDSGLVKTVKFTNPTYIGDPINAIHIFNEKEVDELVVLDVSASIEHREPPYGIIQEIASECFMPLAYGGGVKNIEQIQKIFQIGVEKVIINSAAIETPNFVREAARLCGSQSIVVSIDVKRSILGKYEVYTYRGTKRTGQDPVKVARAAELHGAGEIMLTSIDREGTMKGYDLTLLKMVTDSVRIPVIASGGAGSLADFQTAVHQGGASAVAAGSFFIYHGPHRAVLINYPSASELKTLENHHD